MFNETVQVLDVLFHIVMHSSPLKTPLKVSAALSHLRIEGFSHNIPDESLFSRQ